MNELFLKIINMSISASWLVLAVLICRFVLKKAPKWVNVLLWGIVAVRLICPFSFESALSLIPSAETFPDQVISGPSFDVQTGIAPVDNRINDYLGDRYFEGVTVPTNNGNNVMTILTIVWISGILLLVTYTIISYQRLNRKIDTAVRYKDNIFQSENVSSPFVLGIINPRIYLPFSMNEQDLEHVVAHEQAHIRRKDHWWKPLGFLLLTIHWFNPLMWLAYVLLCRDIELACDEKVIKELGNEQRADYTQALVACSVNRRMIAACPLAFGEVGVKERVKSVMNYKKPAFWIVVFAVTICITVAICFLTNPAAEREFPINGRNVSTLDTERVVEMIAKAEKLDDGSQLCVNDDNFDLMFTSNFEWANDGAIRFFYLKDQKTYSAQLRMFHDDNKYFITDSVDWVEQEQFFKLFHYLDALKYMPQEEIRNLSPDADGFSVFMRNNGVPGDYNRVLKYSQNGVEDINGWYIHLEVQPLHEVEGGAYNGSGDEVIHLFYGHQDLVMLESDSLICYAESEGINSYIEPEHFANGFDWDYEHLAWGEMQSSGKLIFTANWDTDELVVSENYYEKTSPDSTMIHQETYTLARNADGKFELNVDYNNPGTEEMAVYFIRDESGSGRYVMKILFREINNNSSAGTYIAQNDVQFYLTIGSEGVKSIELSMPNSSGGCENADGSLFKKGERIWLENLDDYADLRGLTITALGENGEVIWTTSIPDSEENKGFTHLVNDDWEITNIE